MVHTTARQFLSMVQFLNIAHCPFFTRKTLIIHSEFWLKFEISSNVAFFFYYSTQVNEFLVNEVPGNVGVEVARAIPSTYPGHF